MERNVFFFLKNKAEVKYLYGNISIEQGLKEMKENGYTATPVIDKDGFYLGSVTEGDFLWYLYENEEPNLGKKVKHIVRKDFMKPVTMNTSIHEIFKLSLEQNYVPVVDDRNIFIGIVTRKSILQSLISDIAIQ